MAAGATESKSDLASTPSVDRVATSADEDQQEVCRWNREASSQGIKKAFDLVPTPGDRFFPIPTHIGTRDAAEPYVQTGHAQLDRDHDGLRIPHISPDPAASLARPPVGQTLLLKRGGFSRPPAAS